jgi:RNA polymerase sigma-70 factor (ECF subfamily)
MQSDHDLMEKVWRRDAAAFETLFDRYREPIRRYIGRTVRDESAAEDLLQETFLRVWACAEQWDGRGEFKSWLFRIAANLALNHLRTVRRRKQQPLEPPLDEFDEDDEPCDPNWFIDASAAEPGAKLEQAERHTLLWRLVDGLPKGKREALYLVYRDELSLQEVAEAIGIPEGTVKSRLHYSIKRLAREWKEIVDEDIID